MPHLDRYEAEGIAEAPEDYDPEAELEARLRAEAELDDRDAAEGRVGAGGGGRVRPRALEADDDDDHWRRQQRRRRAADREADGEEEEEEEEFEVDIENYECPLREWITRERTKTEIRRKFSRFLRKFQDTEDGDLVYRKRIREMCVSNGASLEVSYHDLATREPMLAIWVADAPADMLELFNEVAKSEALKLYPAYEAIAKDIFVRITKLPIVDQIRDIRQAHLNCLIKIAGVVTRRTGVFPQLREVMYDCGKCGFIVGPIFQNKNGDETRPGSCPECQSKGPWRVNAEKTVYRNYQKLTLQESPGDVPAGRIPRTKEIILLHDLIDQARPGDLVEITGIYTNNFESSLNRANGFPVFSTYVEANHLSRKSDANAATNLTDEDKEEIRRLSRDPQIARRIVRSIAPSIHGHDDIKAGIALALFGGQEKFVKGKTKLRGDINMLLLGDPGVAKSQFLKYVEKTAGRCVYTTGKGASAVGLTAAVHKDPVTREWVLEGGALVLADRGVCLIDEFDKMNDQDRVSIHEAMEQQSISISKAGIVTTLQARCSVIAAANPVGGRYDSSRTFSDNVELTDPILSRFDIMCVVKDVIDPVLDERLARFVVGSHVRSHPRFDADIDVGANPSMVDASAATSADAVEPIPQETLKKYIAYAKRFVKPKLSSGDLPKISQVYAELRRESVTREGMPVAVRHVESIIRMSEARAAMRLSEHVSSEDIDAAIAVMLASFIGTQKLSVQKSLQKKFARYTHFHRDYDQLLLEILRGIVREMHYWDTVGAGGSAGASGDGANASRAEKAVAVRCRVLEDKASEYGINDLRPFYASAAFASARFVFDEQRGVIVHAAA
jgi:DNA replication licensing factor MCM2